MVRALLFSLWMLTHPVHVSLLSIDYLPDQDSFKVFLKIYYDDFLLDSGIDENGSRLLNFRVDDRFTRNFLLGYTSEKIKIIADDKQLSADLRGYNLEENELTMDFRYGTAPEFKRLAVRNLIMTGLYSDQANMLIVRVDDFEEGVKLTSEKTEQIFDIQ